MHYFLGIDVGTYSSKGVLTDESGKVVSRAVTHHGMENPEPGYYEQDADKVWWNAAEDYDRNCIDFSSEIVDC